MASSKILQLTPAAESELSKIGMELVDIEYRKENQEQILRFFIDKEGGVTLTHCSEATRALMNIVDEQTLYYDHLEVSSPGLDRVIKNDRDLNRFAGQRIKVKTMKAFSGPRTIVGLLGEFNDQEIVVEADGVFMKVPRDQISVVRLHPEI